MWKRIEEENPTFSSQFVVYGTVNIGTEHETKCRFVAKWDNELKRWTDFNGDDFTGINESVEFWYDFNYIANPL